jgi:HlyD family secretion protein
LGDGYRVEVRIVVWERDAVLKIPTSALFRRGQQWSVFTVENGKAWLRMVEVGQRNALEAEILSGLSAGDEIIG